MIGQSPIILGAVSFRAHKSHLRVHKTNDCVLVALSIANILMLPRSLKGQSHGHTVIFKGLKMTFRKKN